MSYVDPKNMIDVYLKKKNMSVTKFSRLCDIHPNTVYLILKGTPVSALVAAKIEHYTKGDIKYETLTDKPKKRRRWDRYPHIQSEKLLANFAKII